MIEEARQPIAVHLYGPLADKYGPLHHFAVGSPHEAVRALDANYPRLRPRFRGDPSLSRARRWRLARGRACCLGAGSAASCIWCRRSRAAPRHRPADRRAVPGAGHHHHPGRQRRHADRRRAVLRRPGRAVVPVPAKADGAGRRGPQRGFCLHRAGKRRHPGRRGAAGLWPGALRSVVVSAGLEVAELTPWANWRHRRRRTQIEAVCAHHRRDLGWADPGFLQRRRSSSMACRCRIRQHPGAAGNGPAQPADHPGLSIAADRNRRRPGAGLWPLR